MDGRTLDAVYMLEEARALGMVSMVRLWEKTPVLLSDTPDDCFACGVHRIFLLAGEKPSDAIDRQSKSMHGLTLIPVDDVEPTNLKFHTPEGYRPL